jgi:hypothetical protein
MEGSRKNGNKYRCGGLIRGCAGEWLSGFSKFIGNCSAYVAELWMRWKVRSMQGDLDFAMELHINSQVVVNMIHDGNSMSITCWSLVY